MKTFFNRKRAVGIGVVAVFVAAFLALGLVSHSSSSPPKLQPTNAKGAQLPYAAWFWTMVVSPANPNELLVGTNMGVDRSLNGGKTWKSVGLTTVNVTSLAEVGTSVYAGGVPGANPVIHNTSGRTAPNGIGTLSVSTNHGTSWKGLHPSGLPTNTIQALATDPSGALYALLNTGGLYKSTDGAKSFTLVTAKLGISPWALAITKGQQFVSGDMDGGPHTSANAKAWTSTAYTDNAGGKMVMEYAVQPNDMTNVLMTSIGVVMSTDGGKTWHTTLNSKTMFGPVAYAPKSPEIAYAVGFDRSIWRSDDGGKSWKQVL